MNMNRYLSQTSKEQVLRDVSWKLILKIILVTFFPVCIYTYMLVDVTVGFMSLNIFPSFSNERKDFPKKLWYGRRRINNLFFSLDNVASRGKEAPAAAPKADTSLDYTDIPVAQIRKVLFTPIGDESPCSLN